MQQRVAEFILKHLNILELVTENMLTAIFCTGHAKLNSDQFMVLKLVSSVLRAENHGRLKLAPESCAHGQLPADLNYNAAEPEKGKEVDCMEPFNSTVLLCHSNTLSPPQLRHNATLRSGTHGRHLVHTHMLA